MFLRMCNQEGDISPSLQLWQCRNSDSREIGRLTLRRLALEAGMHGARTSEVLDKSVTHVVAYHREGQEIPGNHILWRYVTEIEYVTTEI